MLLIDGQSVGNTTIGTALSAIPGVALGLGVVWLLGSREARTVDGARERCATVVTGILRT